MFIYVCVYIHKVKTNIEIPQKIQYDNLLTFSSYWLICQVSGCKDIPSTEIEYLNIQF